MKEQQQITEKDLDRWVVKPFQAIIALITAAVIGLNIWVFVFGI